MEYSALSASTTLGKALFMLPHLVIGIWALVAALRKKANPFVGVGGAVFVGVVGFVWTHDFIESLQCRSAAAENNGEWLEGVVSAVRHTYARSGTGTLHFVIANRELTSWSSGINNDCGFIESIGKVGGVREGHMASVLLYQGKVIKFTSAP